MQFPTPVIRLALAAAACLFLATPGAAQSDNPLRDSWLKSGGKSLAARLETRFADAPAVSKLLSGGGKGRPVRFTATADSGAVTLLAEMLAGEPGQANELKESLEQLKSLADAELAKAGKQNDLAAAFTLFVAGCAGAAGNTVLPSETAQEHLVKGFGALLTDDLLAGASAADRHRMYDWLITSGTFVMLAHQSAKQAGNAEAVKNAQTLGDAFLQAVFAVDPNSITLNETGVKVTPRPRGVPVEVPAGQAVPIVGRWGKSASGRGAYVGLDGQYRITPSGYIKSEYTFAADGTYRYRYERWAGYTRSGKDDEYWTRSESGTYALNGDRLQLNPARSTSLLWSREGKSMPGPALPAENTVYRARRHFFEELKETQLIITPDKETARDGSFNGGSAFPNCYLLSPDPVFEWKFD